MKKTPMISVIIPVYNAAAFICNALDSVRSQTFRDYEIIVVDDGSTDNTVSIVNNFPNIRLFHQANQGCGAARNRGVDEAQGEYLAFLDADDIWHPQKLEIQMQVVREIGDFSILATGFTKFNDYQRTGRRKTFQIEKPPVRRISFNDLLQHWVYLPSSILVSKKVYQEIGGTNPRWLAAQDRDFSLRATARLPVYQIKWPLFRYYIGGQNHLSSRRRLSAIVNTVLILEQWHPEQGTLHLPKSEALQGYLRIFKRKVFNNARNVLKRGGPQLFELYWQRFSYIFGKRAAWVKRRLLLSRVKFWLLLKRRHQATNDVMQNLQKGRV
jgi:glycosyltransferase involved in cell wall biosynthesis